MHSCITTTIFSHTHIYKHRIPIPLFILLHLSLSMFCPVIIFKKHMSLSSSYSLHPQQTLSPSLISQKSPDGLGFRFSHYTGYIQVCSVSHYCKKIPNVFGVPRRCHEPRTTRLSDACGIGQVTCEGQKHYPALYFNFSFNILGLSCVNFSYTYKIHN